MRCDNETIVNCPLRFAAVCCYSMTADEIKARAKQTDCCPFKPLQMEIAAARAECKRREDDSACLDLVYRALKDMGVCSEDTPPMCIPEAVASALATARAECDALKARVSELEAQLTKDESKHVLTRGEYARRTVNRCMSDQYPMANVETFKWALADIETRQKGGE